MKIKKIIAAVAAAAVAVSTMAISAFAIDKSDYYADGTLYLVADDGSPQWAVDNNVDITSIYGAKVYCTFDASEIADDSAWIGGGIGTNSPSSGWKQVEWGRNAKEIIADLDNGTITWQSTEPLFKADDKYAHIWTQAWGGTVTFDKIELLDKDGNVIEGGAAPAETEAATDETADEATDDAAEAEEADDTADEPDDVEDEDVDEPVDDEADEPADEDVEDAAPADEADNTPAETTAAPEGETATAAPATGNVPAAVMISVMAVAGIAAVATKKSK
ncbi:MAG: hypothetical protein NC253_08045 [Ruminococcus sp.]|nr:hypothetical protein [Ruminococcus sp.]MCM1380642.1 hypothetical protein [Muribaculaceae bacterium]MCM1478182.1 hypothetical protein [Muribaculaceae bacterium]